MSADLKGGGFDAREFRDVLVDRDVLAAGDVVAVGYVQPRLVKAAGDACNASGTVNDVGGLAQDANGKPLYCDRGTATYVAAGGSGGGAIRKFSVVPNCMISQCIDSTGNASGDKCAPACPAGTSQLFPGTCQITHFSVQGVCYLDGAWYWECERWCFKD